MLALDASLCRVLFDTTPFRFSSGLLCSSVTHRRHRMTSKSCTHIIISFAIRQLQVIPAHVFFFCFSCPQASPRTPMSSSSVRTFRSVYCALALSTFSALPSAAFLGLIFASVPLCGCHENCFLAVFPLIFFRASDTVWVRRSAVHRSPVFRLSIRHYFRKLRRTLVTPVYYSSRLFGLFLLPFSPLI